MSTRPASLDFLERGIIAGHGFVALLRLWWRRARTRRALRELDDRLLADIGRSEAERRCECAKRFWQA
jgi:uncharacterized protein YjiS (DUF1127 family)